MQLRRRDLLKMGICGVLAKLLTAGSAFSETAPGLFDGTGRSDDAAAVAAELLEIMETRGIHKHPTLGYYYSGYGEDLYTWEVYFDSILLLHAGETNLGKCALKIYLSSQKQNGFIPRRWPGVAPLKGEEKVWNIYESEEHAQPFLFQVALLLSRANAGDVSWITDEIYEGLKKYLRHWEAGWKRDTSELCVWASGPHSGEDNQFDRVGVWRSYFCAGVDVNTFLYMEYLAAEKIAKAKNKFEDAALFATAGQTKKEAIQKLLWDEEDGFYYDRDVRTGKHIRVKSVAGFYPLWAGIPNQEQAKRLVEQHLLNTGEFWCAHPVPSYALNERNYTQHHIPPPLIDIYYALDEGHSNWRGGAWGHSNYFITHGLQRYKFDKEAKLLAQKSFEVSAPDKKIREFYNAETGEGAGGVGVYAGAEMLMRFLPAEISTRFQPMLIEDAAQPISGDSVRAALGLNQKFRLRT
jgi:putative isomerase